MNLQTRFYTLDKFQAAVDLGKVSQVVLEPHMGGWILRADFGAMPMRTTVYLRSQRDNQPRVFKTADAALRLLFDSGVGTVSVRLAAYEPPKSQTRVLLT